MQTMKSHSAQAKPGFFARCLPVMGGLSSLISIACNNIISMVSMQVTMAGLTDKSTSNTFSIVESLSASLFNVIVYFNSPANNALAQLGDKMDKFSWRQKKPERERVEIKPSCCTSTKIILMKVGLGLLVVNYVANGAVIYYQELDALGEKARATDSLAYPILFDVVKWITVPTGSIALLSFYLSFIQKATGRFEKYLTKAPVEVKDEAPAESKDAGDEENALAEAEFSSNGLLLGKP
jgi:hypothetical protein